MTKEASGGCPLQELSMTKEVSDSHPLQEQSVTKEVSGGCPLQLWLNQEATPKKPSPDPTDGKKPFPT